MFVVIFALRRELSVRWRSAWRANRPSRRPYVASFTWCRDSRFTMNQATWSRDQTTAARKSVMRTFRSGLTNVRARASSSRSNERDLHRGETRWSMERRRRCAGRTHAHGKLIAWSVQPHPQLLWWQACRLQNTLKCSRRRRINTKAISKNRRR